MQLAGWYTVADFRMPLLGADMESATLVEWLVAPGQAVKRGQVVAVVETEKGAVEVEIWEAGVIDALVVQPGTEVPVGGLLATLRGAETAGAPAASLPASAQPAPVPPAPAPGVPPAAAPLAATTRIKASPAARRRAEELGIDLARIAASAADGVIALEDVERAAGEKRPAAGIARPDKQAAMRQAIAAAMAKSKREIPHYYLGTTIDLSRALDWLAQENLERSVRERVLPAAVLAKSVALALLEVPELNGFWREDRFVPAPSVHLGMAIALRGGGLIAPAIHDVQAKSVPEIMAALSDLIARARAGALRSSELTDATATMTSLGDQGVETVYGVIYPPQVALVGLGKVAERPWVSDGTLSVRRVIHATLSADHRASVGHRGALFLAALDRILQQPERL
jgi:pyruvate dehydrogenase E2 component (dihydrolipoamide acetyltransferase)